jgi:hypothetical protein
VQVASREAGGGLGHLGQAAAMTCSIAERILIELEKRGGERNMYSFDYDPLDGRW